MHHAVVPGAAAGAEVRKSQLSYAQQWLVDLMSKLRFGRIESLLIAGGQPVLNPAPRVIRTLKVGGRHDGHAQGGATDFVLKAAVVELLAHLRQVGDGIVERIEVAHGMPLLLEIPEQVVP